MPIKFTLVGTEFGIPNEHINNSISGFREASGLVNLTASIIQTHFIDGREGASYVLPYARVRCVNGAMR